MQNHLIIREDSARRNSTCDVRTLRLVRLERCESLHEKAPCPSLGALCCIWMTWYIATNRHFRVRNVFLKSICMRNAEDLPNLRSKIRPRCASGTPMMHSMAWHGMRGQGYQGHLLATPCRFCCTLRQRRCPLLEFALARSCHALTCNHLLDYVARSTAKLCQCMHNLKQLHYGVLA